MCNQNDRNQNVYDVDLESAIYKYIPLKYLKQLIENNVLYFNRVSSWEDVYENWFLKEDLMLPSGEHGTAKKLIPGVFGQCWTLLEESDAMWRIYSKIDNSENREGNYLDETSVRIRTTARKLYDAIYRDAADMARAFIGKVNYLSQEEFDRYQDSFSPLPPLDLNEVFVTSYFLKRNPFDHEQEVRPIVIYSPEEEQFGRDGVTFEINADDFIEEIVVDPRLSQEEFNSIKASLMLMEVYSGKIKQSQLYQWHPHTILLQ